MKYNDTTQLSRYIIMKLREEGYVPYLDRFSIDNSKMLYKYLIDKMPEFTAMMDASYQYTKVNDNLYKYELKPNTKYSLITQLTYDIGVPQTEEDAEKMEKENEGFKEIETLDSTLKVMNWIEFENEWNLMDSEDEIINNGIKHRLIMTIKPLGENIQEIQGVTSIRYTENGWVFTDYNNNTQTIPLGLIKASIFEPIHNIICYISLHDNKIRVIDYSGIYIKSYNYESLVKEIIVENTVVFKFYQNNTINYYLNEEEQRDFKRYETTVDEGIKINMLAENITADTFNTINNKIGLYKLVGGDYVPAEAFESDTDYYVDDGSGNYFKYAKERAINLYTNTYLNSTVEIDGTEYFLLPNYNIINGFSPVVNVDKTEGVGIRILDQQTYSCYFNYESSENGFIPVIDPITSDFKNNGTLRAFDKYLNLFIQMDDSNTERYIKLFDKDDQLLLSKINKDSIKVFMYKYNYKENTITELISENFANSGKSPEVILTDENTEVVFGDHNLNINENECIIINSIMNIGNIGQDTFNNLFNYKIIIFKDFGISVCGDMQILKFENTLVQTNELELTATTDIVSFTTGESGIMYLKSVNENASLSDLPVILREQSEYSELLSKNQVTTEHLDMILLDRIITKYSEREDIEYLQKLLGFSDNSIDGVWNELMSRKLISTKVKNKINSIQTQDFVYGDVYTSIDSSNIRHIRVAPVKIPENTNDLFTKETELTLELLNLQK